MVKFHKYHGAGNDFIMINNLDNSINLKSDYIKFLCDRHKGIGADGLILIEKSDKADCFMNYFNSDGTIAEMCGNGVRCTADFYIKETNSNKKEFILDTRAGLKEIKVNDDQTYSVNIGSPIFESLDFPATSRTGDQTNIEGFNFSFVSMGNPHAVTIIEDLNKIDIKEIGPKIENNSLFPNKINVEFVEKVDEMNYKVKVWERGCGETLACGTGACAVYVIIKKKVSLRPCLRDKEITIEFPGGKLYLSENHEGEIILRGPATFVFKGEII